MKGRRTTEQMNSDWSSDPKWVPDWRWVLSNRLRERGSGGDAAVTKMKRVAPASLTRQQIVDYYESLLSESYKDWHVMLEANNKFEAREQQALRDLGDANLRIGELEDRNNALARELGKAVRQLHGLLKLVEAQPVVDPHLYSDTYAD